MEKIIIKANKPIINALSGCPKAPKAKYFFLLSHYVCCKLAWVYLKIIGLGFTHSLNLSGSIFYQAYIIINVILDIFSLILMPATSRQKPEVSFVAQGTGGYTSKQQKRGLLYNTACKQRPL
jgi:hypothetical protein